MQKMVFFDCTMPNVFELHFDESLVFLFKFNAFLLSLFSALRLSGFGSFKIKNVKDMREGK